jgi:hypothetical protein
MAPTTLIKKSQQSKPFKSLTKFGTRERYMNLLNDTL